MEEMTMELLPIARDVSVVVFVIVYLIQHL
jgi:hypothetical protein